MDVSFEDLGLSGSVTHGLDPKNRIFIPADFRDKLSDKLHIYRFAVGNKKRLRVYTDDYYRARAKVVNEKEEAAETPEELEEADRLSQNFFGKIDDAKMDKQGRITLSTIQLSYADIKDEVVIVGKSRYFEIWSVDGWNKATDDSI